MAHVRETARQFGSRLKKFTFVKFTMVHPFKGYFELRREINGSLEGGLFLTLIWMISSLMRKQLTGFLFNPNYGQSPNFLLDAFTVLGPFFLWCVANWCLTTLMDGEGRMKDVITALGYSVTPLIFGNVLYTILSNFLGDREALYLQTIDNIFLVWAVFLIVIGTLTIHNYTLLKTIVTCILTVVVIAVILFLILLVFTLAQEILGFITSLYKEISYRGIG